MTTANPTTFHRSAYADDPAGMRLHRFTDVEFRRMRKFDILGDRDPIELRDGRIYIDLDEDPPYGVPLGIPPEVITAPGEPNFPQRRFTVDEYLRMTESCALDPNLRTELVEGWVIDKMTRGARHDSTLERAAESLAKRLGKQWRIRVQSGLIMDSGVPEPDIAIVRGPRERYKDEHPRPSDVGLIIEVSDSTLATDRTMKMRDYARNGIPRYLILNVIARQVEDYQIPSGPTENPKYGQRTIYKLGDLVPLTLGQRKQKPIPVDELIWSS